MVAATAKTRSAPIRRRRGESLGRRALRPHRRDRLAVTCFAVIGLYVLVTVLGYAGALPDFQERVGEKYEPPSFTLARCSSRL